MTDKNEYKHLHELRGLADEYSLWRRMALDCLLTNVAPRLGALRNCRRDMVSMCGHLLATLATDVGPGARQSSTWVGHACVRAVAAFENLCQDLCDAERKERDSEEQCGAEYHTRLCSTEVVFETMRNFDSHVTSSTQNIAFVGLRGTDWYVKYVGLGKADGCLVTVAFMNPPGPAKLYEVSRSLREALESDPYAVCPSCGCPMDRSEDGRAAKCLSCDAMLPVDETTTKGQ